VPHGCLSPFPQQPHPSGHRVEGSPEPRSLPIASFWSLRGEEEPMTLDLSGPLVVLSHGHHRGLSQASGPQEPHNRPPAGEVWVSRDTVFTGGLGLRDRPARVRSPEICTLNLWGSGPIYVLRKAELPQDLSVIFSTWGPGSGPWRSRRAEQPGLRTGASWPKWGQGGRTNSLWDSVMTLVYLNRNPSFFSLALEQWANNLLSDNNY
jgi:hypothetical protein